MSKSIYIVVRGGIGSGRQESHNYGELVLKVLQNKNIQAGDLYLHPSGLWTLDGMMTKVEEIVTRATFVYIAFVGIDGENGHMQKMCEEAKVQYSGNTHFHSTLAQDKNNFKKLAKQHGIKSPYGQHVKHDSNHTEAAKDIFSKIEIPMIVKANHGSGKDKVYAASSYQEIENIIQKLFQNRESVLAEKLIKGIDVKVLVTSFENRAEAFVVVESEEAVSADNLREIYNQALTLHNRIGFIDTVEYDFVINKNGVYLLEANTYPDLLHADYSNFWNTENSLENYILNRFDI